MALNPVFVDTVYWIALLHPGENFHSYAVEQWGKRDARLWVTSDLVLIEVLNFFAQRGPTFRRAAVRLVERFDELPNVRVVKLHDLELRRIAGVYDRRRDKGWSLTDCSSFSLMKDMGIREALTLDRHFEQAGFTAIMKEGNPRAE